MAIQHQIAVFSLLRLVLGGVQNLFESLFFDEVFLSLLGAVAAPLRFDAVGGFHGNVGLLRLLAD